MLFVLYDLADTSMLSESVNLLKTEIYKRGNTAVSTCNFDAVQNRRSQYDDCICEKIKLLNFRAEKSIVYQGRKEDD